MSTKETWGLKAPNGAVLLQGYSQRPLHSEQDVRADFSPSLFAEGYVPILIETRKTMRYTGTAGGDSQTAISHLLSAAILLSPDEKAAAGFTRLVVDMANAGEREQDTAKALAASILDGMRFGNWPT